MSNSITLTDLLAACRADARAEGWDGNDREFEYSAQDLEWVVEKFGRLPTREEWRAAGLEWVGDAHVSEDVVFTAPEWVDAVIAEEGMDFASLVVTATGRLSDDQASEPADLSSADAFRAQVRRWRQAVSAPEDRSVVERVADEIARARQEIASTTDGPITAFALIGRACLGASRHPDMPSAYAHALHEELVERGWIDAEAVA